MFLLGFRRKLTALALCKSMEYAIQWFQIHHITTFANIQNPAVNLSGARVSIFSTLVSRLYLSIRPLARGNFVEHIFLKTQCLARILQHVSPLTMAALSYNSLIHTLPYKDLIIKFLFKTSEKCKR